MLLHVFANSKLTDTSDRAQYMYGTRSFVLAPYVSLYSMYSQQIAAPTLHAFPPLSHRPLHQSPPPAEHTDSTQDHEKAYEQGTSFILLPKMIRRVKAELVVVMPLSQPRDRNSASRSLAVDARQSSVDRGRCDIYTTAAVSSAV